MASGYKILWTQNAILELEGIIAYLEEHWTERELKNFSRELDHVMELISKNPELFQASSAKKDVRRAVIGRYTNLYYRMGSNTVEILSLFSNRQNPSKLKL
ncbi:MULTISPECIES: type II toxin-antitoxin system RelE/ParE family toxin [unclassified Allomuricauda]|jgi:plasmid stabilization system protein ParE|uniref:type II toxin-antitoxin system RelE/ParE family toxin n=1 Tax=unclassified Allomuricauda TaxID=2615049 RepID=UPI001B09AA9A|nr:MULTISPECIES: type II toxin-antitoxin system RelE/ParE family toxin [unclassified Allomuricauda]MBO6531630.1 type II toxin-antitoxin system RelE/ParE family toxin [Allomuricauda sp.]MBO6589630.1 type II toxin-antitoxin system RelE/ParE family toxin [Allomuricauda sp.]MBO6619437.1 type II toxin-antitoxin system RelE/ParE family toxin [Allomuricauda sp.]MBO6645348.1 type II toxin-antitoxin system RelE/ParE family toxin [Allomuricauda sp.]MBO6747376.1 type II toxin-antitoxin system RelE/ParE f